MHTERLSELTRRYELHAALDQRRLEIEQTADVVRLLTLKAAYNITTRTALDYFEQQFHRKANVPSATTTDEAWAGALMAPTANPILAVVRRNALPERLGLTKVPFNLPVPSQTSLGTFAWVAQNKPKPATKLEWGSVTLPPGKIAGIVSLTKELAKLAPGAEGSEGVITRALTGGIISYQDRQLLDPAVALVANEHPASITNGIAPITASAADLAGQVRELLAALFAGRPQTQRPVLVATPAVVVQLAAGEPSLTVAGGTFSGVPVVPSPEAGSLVVALDAAAVVYADGGLDIDTSENATVESSDTPTTPPGAAGLISLWQTNRIGFRVERMLWWQAVEANAVQVLAVAP